MNECVSVQTCAHIDWPDECDRYLISPASYFEAESLPELQTCVFLARLEVGWKLASLRDSPVSVLLGARVTVTLRTPSLLQRCWDLNFCLCGCAASTLNH